MFHLLAPSATVLLLTLNPAPMADWYVDINAANCSTGTGGPLDPVCSISSAIALASPGDTIRIAPGTYSETVDLISDLDLIATAGPAVTIVDAGGAGSVLTVAQSVTARVEGLTLTGGAHPTGGGGVRNLGDLTLVNSTISNNTAGSFFLGTYGKGGGITSSEGDLILDRVIVDSNYAESLGMGGGLYIYSGSATILDSTFRENRASNSGGAITVLGSGSLSMDRSLVAENESTFSGGGLVIRSTGTTVLRSSTISGNISGRDGGGVYSLGGPNTVTCRLENCTVTQNRCSGYGTGIYNLYTSSYFQGVLLLEGCLVARNFGPPQFDFEVGGLFTSLGHNLIADNYFVPTATDLALPPNFNVGLGPLQDNGGPTETHALMSTSPAVDAGSAIVASTTDQRGMRLPSGFARDIGAFERQAEFCFGDGGNQAGCTDCPCSNNATPGADGGCLNSAASSARLRVFGEPSVSADTFAAGLEGGVPNAFAILSSGDNLAPSNPMNPCFGQGSGVTFAGFDGLRCVVQGVLRHGTRAMDASGAVGVTTNRWGAPQNSILGTSGFTTGQTRHFQVVYREAVTLGCMTGLNTSQAVSVMMKP